MKTSITFSAIAFCLLSASPAFGQEVVVKQTYGDASLKEAIGPKVRAIYDREGRRVFLLTKDNLQDLEDAHATELQGIFVYEHFIRIVATTWTPAGKYSVEYFWEGEALLFTYETFEYFESVSPPNAWRNFKGIASWERRSYYDRDNAGYVETTGRSNAGNPDAGRLVAAGRRMAEALSERMTLAQGNEKNY